MTGTSLDALDGAAARLEGDGLAMRLVSIDATVSIGLPEPLRATLGELSSGAPLPIARAVGAARELGVLHAIAARDLIARARLPDLVCAHGQTVHHAPPDSLQLFNPWPLALAVGRPVVYDLRGADLACGGQGAPITPIADWVLFRAADETRAVVNLGGFCNLTLLPAGGGPERVRGFDVCACNHVLNGAARLALGRPFDEGGAGALRGRPVDSVVSAVLDALGAQRGQGRSLGSGDEATAMIAAAARSCTGDDLVASVTRAVGLTIADSLRAFSPVPGRVLLAGGSARNAALVKEIARACPPTPVVTTDAMGVPAAHREAVGFAVLGALCADRVPITLASVTGARGDAPISGAWIDPRPNQR